MTKAQISADLIRAGLDKYLVESFWNGNECHVSNYDLDVAASTPEGHEIIMGLVEACGEDTDKGVLFIAA